MQEGRINLEKVNYCVDYVITHCASNRVQDLVTKKLQSLGREVYHDSPDQLTDYFSELERRLEYRNWYFGHYHFNEQLDQKHTILYEMMVTLGKTFNKLESMY